MDRCTYVQPPKFAHKTAGPTASTPLAFRLVSGSVRWAPMNRKLRDEQIVHTALKLQAENGAVSGAELRAALARRFGARGDVARVYRLLRLAVGAGPSTVAAGEVFTAFRSQCRTLEAQLATARDSLARAEAAEVEARDRLAALEHALADAHVRSAASARRCDELEDAVADAGEQARRAIARAERAEERERLHQDRWMMEVDSLRQKFASSGRAPMLIDNRDPRDLVRDLKAQLLQAKREIATFEARLRHVAD